MTRTVSASLLVFALFGLAIQGLAHQELRPFEEARRLESKGKEREALLRYLSIPGGEYAAARLARTKPEAFVALIVTVADDPDRMQDRPRVILVQGDLLLAAGDREGALKCYRQVTGMIAAEPTAGWKGGLIPNDYYPVQPPQPEHLYAEALPFTLGPGSHRDNWVIRRFIALEAWQDAEKEFRRIWQIHRKSAGEGQFSGLGLEFAIDYAYFLKRQGHSDEALETLLEAILRIDMDRNPNLLGPDRRQRVIRLGDLAGVSRKEFVRIAYGAFKTAGKEEELVVALHKQIEEGENRARRVLARVRLHQGKVDEALALELAYVEAGDFDELSASYRRGLVYEDCRKLAEAVAEYEKALGLPYTPPKLPDQDEEAVQRQMMSSMPMDLRRIDPNSPAGRAKFQAEALDRLHRLYGALGKMDKVLEVTLRQYEANPSLLRDFRSLEQATRRFQAAGREADLTEWARRQIEAIKDPAALANLHWIVGDHAAAANALAEAARATHSYGYGLQDWKDRFRSVGNDKLQLLLEALIKANPDDACSRLELLDLEDRFEGEEVISALEILLDRDAPPAFARGKGEYNRTRFRNYYDLAYRLMRLYEKGGQLEKLRALGLRIARGEKPFAAWRSIGQRQYEYRRENDLPEDVNACLALVIQHADAATLDALEEALESLPDHPAKAQLARRKAGGWKPDARGAIGWANLPDGVSALVCNENVLSLACDDTNIYAGMPWGVAVYTHKGEPVTRIGLETAALDLLIHQDHLWVGTPIGLNRITVGSWEVAYLALDRDIPERDREPDRSSFQNGVCALALDGDFLWIGARRNIQRLDTDTNTLRVYSQEELGVSQHADWDHFVVEGEYVWADGGVGCRRYDRRSDTWAQVSYDNKPVNLVASVDGVLWGHVWLNDELRDRPCLIDRGSLEVTPVLIEQTPQSVDRQISGPFAYFGTWHGKPVLGPRYPAFFYDAEIKKLRPLPAAEDVGRAEIESDILPGLWGGLPWRKPDGRIVCYNVLTHKHNLFGDFPFFTGYWTMARLPDGTVILGGRRERCPRYQYPQEDWPEAYETWDEEGGLYLISPDQQVRRISSVVTKDSLPGDEALSVVFARAYNDWVCTNRGLAALSEEDSVLAHFTRADGLCANRVVGGVALGGRVYFATGWGDHGGGLVVYDPRTTVFTALLQSDGLATDKLAGVELLDGKLKLVYDVEYMRSGRGEYRLHPPGLYDPATGSFKPGGEPGLMRQSEAHKTMYSRREDRRPMPYLGGFILSEVEHKGRKYLCGTRGLVVVPRESDVQPLTISMLMPKLVLDPAIALHAAAEATEVEVLSPVDLERFLESENPFVRAKALERVRLVDDNAPYAELLGRAAEDPNLRVRSTAVFLLAQVQNDAAIPHLRASLNDPNRPIRRLAAIGLARCGVVTDLSVFEGILEHPGTDRFPYGVSAWRGDSSDTMTAYAALAPHADDDVFGLMLRHPISSPSSDQDSNAPIFRDLGASLRKHPEASAVLLTAYGHQVRFAQAVFGYAGKDMLPVLHEALRSEDRVVRSNAARGCGAIGDPSSVPHLIKALDLESGLARASIVWALGELKAKEALPHLVKLYVDARNDEKRRRGAGFRATQSQAEIGAHYDSISSLDSVSADWDELKLSLRPQPVDPRRVEELIRPEHVMEAVRKIGPAASQEFYRALAGEEDAEARREAAIYLAEGDEQDTRHNLPILRSLLADTDIHVRMRAAASLLALGQDVARQPVLEWLGSPNEWEKSRILEQLLRVKNAEQLDFARARIEAIAADPALHEGTGEVARQILREVLTK